MLSVKVTKLVACKKQGRLNVYIDDNFVFAAYSTVLSEFSIVQGAEISKKTVSLLLDADKRLFAKNTALSALSRKDYSYNGIIKKLCEKDIEKTHAVYAADYLCEIGYINDERFVKAKTKYLFEIKKFGKRRVITELVRSGIDKDLATGIAESYNDHEAEAALLFIRDYISKYKPDEKVLKRAFDRLIRKGHSFENARRAIRTIKEEQRNFDELD